MVEADGGNNGLREDFISMGRKHPFQPGLRNGFMGAFPGRGRPPRGSYFPYVVAKCGGDDAGEQEIVAVLQLVMSNIKGCLQDIVGVVVKGNVLEDFEEALMLPQVPSRPRPRGRGRPCWLIRACLLTRKVCKQYA